MEWFRVFCFVLLAALASFAADNESVAGARSLALGGHRPEALHMLEAILRNSPGNSDARVLSGLILSWEGRYDDARREFTLVLAENRDNGDAIKGLINVELWSDHPDRAEKLAAAALERKGQNASLLFAKARALRAQNRQSEALSALDQLLAIDPINQEALSSERSIKESMEHWRVSYSNTFDWFRHGGGNWNESSASFNRATAAGSLTATFSRADRFGYHSNLSEITFYPHIRKGTYGFLGFGYSYDGNLYPYQRIGAEIFQSLPLGFEASAGYRRFMFSGSTNMFTGSLGKYKGNWLLTARVYVTPDALGSTHSISFSARRYLSSGDGDFIGFRVGHGPSPYDPRSTLDLQTLMSSSGYVEIKKTIDRHWACDFVFGMAVEQRQYSVSADQFTLQSTAYYRF